MSHPPRRPTIPLPTSSTSRPPPLPTLVPTLPHIPTNPPVPAIPTLPVAQAIQNPSKLAPPAPSAPSALAASVTPTAAPTPSAPNALAQLASTRTNPVPNSASIASAPIASTPNVSASKTFNPNAPTVKAAASNAAAPSTPTPAPSTNPIVKNVSPAQGPSKSANPSSTAPTPTALSPSVTNVPDKLDAITKSIKKVSTVLQKKGVQGREKKNVTRAVRRIRGNSPTQRGNEVSREVFYLTGERTPASVMPAGGLRDKPSRKKAWKWVEFSNSARKDGLKLEHWEQVGTQQGADYKFAKFNKEIKMMTYTDEEYKEAVAGLETPEKRKWKEGDMHYVPPQKKWTREETDILFDLCKQFDMRFVVIHDRWPVNLAPRSVNEIKDRYFTVTKALIDRRIVRDAEKKFEGMSLALQKHCQSIMLNPFDYEYECIRKNQLEVQYRRSKTELREEEETVREARRIEANRKRIAKERSRLARLLTPAGDIAMMGANAKNGEGGKGTGQGWPQKTFPHRKVVSGAYARSSMIYTPVTSSSKLSRRIDEALVELGVGMRPTPTSIVVDNFDLLRMEILHYIELQRTVSKKEEDVHLLRIKLAKMNGQPPPPLPEGVTITNKKRRSDEVENGSLFGGPPAKIPKVSR